jgi:hypothetical protein
MYEVIPELIEIGVGNDLCVIRGFVVEDVPEGVFVAILSLLSCGLLCRAFLGLLSP